MRDLFAACDPRDLDIELVQRRFLNRSIIGIVLIEGRLCFSYYLESGEKLVKGGIGYLCFFEESFLSGEFRKRVLELPMFVRGGRVEYVLCERDYEKARYLFVRIIEEQGSAYQYKFDLIRTYLTQILHLVMKMG